MKLSIKLIGALAITLSGMAPAAGQNIIKHDPPYVLRQAYLLLSEKPVTKFSGFAGVSKANEAALPGFFTIDPGLNWKNFISAAKAGIRYTIQDLQLIKTTPEIFKCSDVFPARKIVQRGMQNIRLHWPLMYEVPGTKWQLKITYGTSTKWDPDGPGPLVGSYVHTDLWKWRLTVDITSLQTLLILFHEVPFGTDQVPLISDELLYGRLQWLLTAAKNAVSPYERSQILQDFELEVMDHCIGISPDGPYPTGPATGIAQTLENPACCKILVDADYIFAGL